MSVDLHSIAFYYNKLNWAEIFDADGKGKERKKPHVQLEIKMVQPSMEVNVALQANLLHTIVGKICTMIPKPHFRV